MKRRDFVKTASVLGTRLLFGSPFSLAAQVGQPVAPDPDVKWVLVMFKCHFDAGFIDTQANVVKKYFTMYFPHAIEVARAANEGGQRRYVWTTGSWLLYEYLEQAGPEERKAMEQAIARGDIAWHALPFTWQTEMLDPSMIEGALAISKSLDRRFGQVTMGAKMTDVPGHTRGLIPPLAKHGVNFLEIGVNGGSTAAKLPPLFLWKSPAGMSLPVMYHWDYSGIAKVPGSDLAVVTRVRGDNSGPHTAEEIEKIHAELHERFPNAEITAASLSKIAEAVNPHRGALPVVTQEIGDTWIYGCGSDPVKVARYRMVARLREHWIGQGTIQTGDETDLALLRHVLLEAEHTWGADTKTWLDFDNYKAADLARMIDTKNYKVVEFSWQEKRQDLLDGVATLPVALRQQAENALQSLAAAEPKPGPSSVAHAVGEPIETTHFLIQFDPKTGAMTRLYNRVTQREWAGAANPVGLVTYQTLSQGDYDQFMGAYLTTHASWALRDFGKPNIDKIGTKSQEWHPVLKDLQVEESERAHRIVGTLKFEDEDVLKSGLAAFPGRVFVEMLLPKTEPSIHLHVILMDKPATRLPEGLWLTFNPIAADPKGWTLEKSGAPVSPFDVVENGNRHMHALSRGFEYGEGGKGFAVETLDAPVVALGQRTPLLFSNDQPDLSKGVHSSLYNNAWGTNYIMWFGEDMRFRFVLRA